MNADVNLETPTSENQGTVGGSNRTPILVKLASAVIVISALRLAGGFFVPIIFGVFLAVVSFPVMNWMEARRIPRALAVAITVGINLSVVALLIYFSSGFLAIVEPGEVRVLILRIVALGGNAAEWMEVKGVTGAVTAWDDFISSKSFPVPKTVELPGPSTILEGGATVTLQAPRGDFIDSLVAGLVGLIRPFFEKLTSWAGTGIFVFVIMVFALGEGRAFTRKIAGIRKADGPDFSRFDGAAADIQRYLRIKTIASIATGVLAGLLCLAVGVEDALLWGLLAFLLNFIPVVGSIIASLPPFVMTLANTGPLPAAIILVGYIAINFGIGNFLEPTLLGRRFGLSTLIVVISVFFWGWMWGPVGMFLAVPLTMIFKVIFDNSEDFKWLSIAMGKGPDRRALRKAARAEREASEAAAKKAETIQPGI